MEESWWERRWSPLLWTASAKAPQQRQNEIIGWGWDQSLWFREHQRASAGGGAVHSPTSPTMAQSTAGAGRAAAPWALQVFLPVGLGRQQCCSGGRAGLAWLCAGTALLLHRALLGSLSFTPLFSEDLCFLQLPPASSKHSESTCLCFGYFRLHFWVSKPISEQPNLSQSFLDRCRLA